MFNNKESDVTLLFAMQYVAYVCLYDQFVPSFRAKFPFKSATWIINPSKHF